jgi:penicillin-binding protein A
MTPVALGPVTVSPPLPSVGAPPRPRTRRRARLRRLIPVVLPAAGAFAGGMVAGGRHEPSERRLANRYASAWARGDHAAMYEMLTPAARGEISLRRFTRMHRRAAETATLASLETGRPRNADDDAVVLPVVATTRIFGPIDAEMTLPLGEDDDGEAAIAWAPHLVFPGLRPDEKLGRRTRLAPRATIEARDGTPIAKGEARLSELDPLASEIAGRVGPAPPERASELRRRGVPARAPVGLTGLEREFDERLAGTPGGELLAGLRVLASTEPLPGQSVRSTIDPGIQRAAVEALAGRYGGIAAVRPRDGEVLALAGVAFSAPQPPGSVFKMITLAGAVEAGTVKRNESFPVQTAATLEGVELENANGESCGGSLIASFAHSCNSVFAPMGAELGAEKLVAAAERFGFNEDPLLAGEGRSTIPAAGEIGDDLAVGSTAIGQGKVLATALQMALVAAAIGEDGERHRPTLLKGDETESVQATPPEVARFVGRGMRAVVTEGTGVGAAIPGIRVAGKTGTAELRSTVSEDPVPVEPGQPVPEEDITDTDAWFAAFAPARDPRIAVAVLLIAQGAGGETAAPAARLVIEAALR